VTETPTLDEVLAIYVAILLDQPVPPGFPETEAELRQQVADIHARGLIPDVPE